MNLVLTGVGDTVRLVEVCTPHILGAIHFVLIHTATLTFEVCHWLIEAVWYTVYGLCVVTKLLVTSSFSLCTWALHILLVCVFTIFHFASYLVPIFEFFGRLTWLFTEKLLDTEALPHPFPMDVAVGAVVTAVLIYALVRGSILVAAQLQFRARASAQLQAQHAAASSDRRPASHNRQPNLSTPRRPLSERPVKMDSDLKEPLLKDVVSNISTLQTELERVKQQRLCVVCLDGQKEVVLKPCRHLCVCSTCAPELDDCPICRRPVQGQEKIFDA